MKMTVTCSHCGRPFQAEASGLAALVAGRKGKAPQLVYRFACPHCGKRTAVRAHDSTRERSPLPPDGPA